MGRDGAGFGAETAQTLDRGLAILDLLSGPAFAHGATVADLAAALDLSRPIVYRLLASLAARDLVVRDAAGRVRLGMALQRLASAVLPTVREAATPLLRVLADTAGATAHLTVAEHDQAVALAVVEPTLSGLHVAYRVGSRHPLDRGAAGRAILAGRRGTAQVVATSGELQTGAHGLAAPVPGLPGFEASVGVVGVEPLDEAAVGPAVLRCAADLAARLRG